jgi:hypothetical protein
MDNGEVSSFIIKKGFVSEVYERDTHVESKTAHYVPGHVHARQRT